MATASAWLAGLSGPLRMSDPQLQVMICGLSATAALKAPVELAKFIFTGISSASGATAKMLADSAVPWPLSSVAALTAPGPSVTASTR